MLLEQISQMIQFLKRVMGDIVVKGRQLRKDSAVLSSGYCLKDSERTFWLHHGTKFHKNI